MAYSKFTLRDALSRFSLTLDESTDIFAPAPLLAPSAFLTTTLSENAPLALALQTEKARSELIITPILMEVRRQALPSPVGFFSGIDFEVDEKQGLSGICDYLLSRAKEQSFVRAPVLAVVEAKNENLKPGYGQCAAEMVAAQLFNEREGTEVGAIYGAVTSGDIWKFLRLENGVLCLDRATYYLDRLESILGILNRIVATPT